MTGAEVLFLAVVIVLWLVSRTKDREDAFISSYICFTLGAILGALGAL